MFQRNVIPIIPVFRSQRFGNYLHKMASAAEAYSFLTEPYLTQRRRYWPKEGRHILAQYDDNSVIVYQAYNRTIADYAVQNQRFGGPDFSYERMSWIKTNFLWMMYRCGWATKKNQERVLAVRITRAGFEEILSKAYTGELQKSKHLTTDKIDVRLQWDPDHAPNYDKCQRRAIQLGMKGETLRLYGTEWILNIEDITKFVRQQHNHLQKKGEEELLTASERIYSVSDANVSARLNMDYYEKTPLAFVPAEANQQQECKTFK